MKNKFLRSELKSSASELESFYPQGKFDVSVLHLDNKTGEEINSNFIADSIMETSFIVEDALEVPHGEEPPSHNVFVIVVPANKRIEHHAQGLHTCKAFGSTTKTRISDNTPA